MHCHKKRTCNKNIFLYNTYFRIRHWVKRVANVAHIVLDIYKMNVICQGRTQYIVSTEILYKLITIKRSQVNQSYLHDTSYDLLSLYGLYWALPDSVACTLPTPLLFTVYIRYSKSVACLKTFLMCYLSYVQIDKSFLTQREVCAVISYAV